MLKGKWIRVTCQKEFGWNCYNKLRTAVDYAGLTFEECINKAKEDGWRVTAKKEICPNCLKRIK
jgi:hypothetical protein